MAAALFFLLLAGSVTIQAQRIEAQHRIDQLDAELLVAQERQRVLRADVAVAESPERVMDAARGLGMVEPGPVLPLVPAVGGTPEVQVSSGNVPEDVPGGAPEGGGPVALGATSVPGGVSDVKVPAGGG